MVRQNGEKRKLSRDIITLFTIFFTGLGAFALGRISVTPQDIQEVQIVEAVDRVFTEDFVRGQGGEVRGVLTQPIEEGLLFVASKNGTRYYPKECPAAGRISEANKRFFKSGADAEQEGYTPAKNCEGYW